MTNIQAVDCPRLYYGDNLEMMRKEGSQFVDLIIADPTYHCGKDYTGSNLENTFKEYRPIIDKIFSGSPFYHELEHLLSKIDKLFKYRLDGEPGAIRTDLAFMVPRIIQMYRILAPHGSIYLHCKPNISHYLKIIMDSIFGIDCFRNELIWCYPPSGNGPKHGYHKKHDVILFYGKIPNEGTFNRPYTQMPKQTVKAYSGLDLEDRNFKAFDHKRSYLDEKPGRPVPSWWTDISPFSVASNSKERFDYPEQKPRMLYERIIKASSNAGDIIFDPFCGSGTVLDVATYLGRSWIAIDSNPTAIEITMKRIGKEYGFIAHKDYWIEGEYIDNLNMPTDEDISPMQLGFTIEE